MKGRRLAQGLLAAGATGVAGYLVVSHLSFGDLTKLARGFDLRFLALGFTAYLGANLTRAFRFRLLVGERISLVAFLRIIFVQNFMNTFLPFRAGEISYLYMVHRSGGVAPGHNLGSLVGARALDLLVALLIPLCASPWSRGWSAPGHPFAWLASFLLLVTTVFGLVVVRGRRLADYVTTRAPP